MFHGHYIIAATNLDNHSVVFKPSIRLGLTSELNDSSRQPKVGRNHCGSDGSAETLWSGDMHSAADGYISVVALSVSSVPVDQTMTESAGT